MDKQQGPTVYTTGNYIEYPIIKYNGKNIEKNMYICIHKVICI